MSGSAFELDHLFVLASVGAPEAQPLIDHGFMEGSRNTHPGQGTANRRFFFRNAMLELLWVADAEEAQTPPASELHLWQRWRQRDGGVSPFGLCLRPCAGIDAAQTPAPFRTWSYQPGYSPRPIAVGTNAATIAEPLLFAMPVHRRPDTAPASQREPLTHANGCDELLALHLFAPAQTLASAEMRALQGVAGVELVPAQQHRLELTLNGGGERVLDCRPALPLLLRY